MNPKEPFALIKIIFFASLTLIVSYKVIDHFSNNITHLIIAGIVIAVYILFIFLFRNKLKKPKNRYLNVLIIATQMPFALILVLSVYLTPIYIILLCFLYYLVISCIFPVIICIVTQHFYSFPIEFNYFVIASLGGIIGVGLHKFIINTILKYHPATSDGKYENKRDLITYVFSLENVRFVIYALYFLFLFIYSIKYITKLDLLSSSESDFSILHSFLVFLSYDNLRVNSKDVRIMASTLWEKLVNSILSDNISIYYPKNTDMETMDEMKESDDNQ